MMKNYFFACIWLLVLFGCGSDTQQNDSPTNVGLSGKVRLDGSSTVFPISEAVAEEYGAIEPRVRVTVGVSGTGGGFKKFLAGETDINDASSSNLERLGDLATNIAEEIIFMEEGEVIRHRE